MLSMDTDPKYEPFPPMLVVVLPTMKPFMTGADALTADPAAKKHLAIIVPFLLSNTSSSLLLSRFQMCRYLEGECLKRAVTGEGSTAANMKRSVAEA